MGSFAIFTCIAAVAMYAVTVSEAQPQSPYNLGKQYYFDNLAQSYCAASEKTTKWTFAIRRGNNAPSCQDLCREAKTAILGFLNHQVQNVDCYEVIRIREFSYLDPNYGYPQPQKIHVNLGTRRYGNKGCTNKEIWGPNHCCCKAY